MMWGPSDEARGAKVCVLGKTVADTLFPDMQQTLVAAETLVKDGFKVMVYCADDPIAAKRLEDIGYMTCMTLTLLGNYAQTGHFGGPLAYTAYNILTHLVGPEFGGMRYDYRRPKHPACDKFMLAGGHCIPTCYALWIAMGEAMERKYKKTGDQRYYVDPNVAMLSVDALGFRRGEGALGADHLVER